MNLFIKIQPTLKFIFWLTLLICCVCSCNEKKVSVERGSQEEAVTNSIDIKALEDGEPKHNTEEFERLKQAIAENLPNLERQLQEALGSSVKLKMVIEDKPETAVNEIVKDVENKLEEIKKNSTEKEK